MREFLSLLFNHPSPLGLLLIAGKTSLIYFFLVAGLRLMGKRELGQMNIYDLVLIIVLANSVQNAMVGEDTTLVGGIVAAVTLLIWNRIFALLLHRSRTVERALVGQPMLILRNGHLMEDRMRREGLTREQVLAALREHGIAAIQDAAIGVLEVDGTISIVPKETGVMRTRRHFKQLRLH